MKSVIAKILRTQKAFTLIELMIVVAIIGILSAIAIPNFARYQSKSRQAEAKIALASIYGGEKAFYAEYSGYISDHSSIGYVPEGFKRYYSVGWSAVGTVTITGFTRTTTQPAYGMFNYPASWTTCDAESLTALPAGLTGGDPQSFTAGAAGQIRDATSCDIWVMNQDKNLINSTINL